MMSANASAQAILQHCLVTHI